MCIISYAEVVVKLILGCMNADLVRDGGGERRIEWSLRVVVNGLLGWRLVSGRLTIFACRPPALYPIEAALDKSKSVTL